MSLKHIVEFTYEAEKIHSTQFDDPVNDRLMPHFIDELRLFKKGLVGYSDYRKGKSSSSDGHGIQLDFMKDLRNLFWVSYITSLQK